VSYRAEQVESPIKPDVQPIGVQSASSDTGTQSFNNTYRQALASRNQTSTGLPDVTFVDGSNSIDYPAQQTGPKSFALGVDKIDVRNGGLDQLGQKFDGIADGLAKAVGGQIQSMAEDPNAVNKGLIQLGGAVEVAFNYYSDKISTGDWNGYTNDVGLAGTAIKQASDAYDRESPIQQGEVIGATMAMFLPVPALARETELANDTTIANRALEETPDLIEGVDKPNEKPPFLQFAENLGDAARNLDPREKAYLREKNISIKGVDEISQVEPNVPEGSTGLCQTVDGVNYEVIISRQLAEKDIPYVLRHELGHAFDRTYLNGKRLCSLPGYQAAYEKDLAALSSDDRALLSRYCKERGNSGKKETIASLYAHAMGEPTDIEREILLKQKFPNTFAWVDGLVEAFKNERI